MVRLKVGSMPATNINQYRFNSTMVRLKAQNGVAHGTPQRRFNSTMVRLKVGGWTERLLEVQFQFHNGSIKSTKYLMMKKSSAMFQFHNGSIKSRIGCPDCLSLLGFQFHNGSIKSCVGRRGLSLRWWFQFHNGSIKSPKNQWRYYRKTALFLQAENYLYFQKSSMYGCAKLTGG